MSDVMAVLLNGIAQIEYDRNKFIQPEQKTYLKRLDEKMEGGIELDGESIDSPDLGQRARFMATVLAHAIRDNNEARCAATTTWLAERLPDLLQVKIQEQDGRFLIDLVFDEEYVKQQPIQFDRPGG